MVKLSSWFNIIKTPKENCSLFSHCYNFHQIKLCMWHLQPVVSVGQTNSMIPDCTMRRQIWELCTYYMCWSKEWNKVNCNTNSRQWCYCYPCWCVLWVNSQHAPWVAFGISKCIALPIFHALTGCSPTSAFRGKGKNSA